VKPEANTIYVATVPDHPPCAAAESAPVTLLVSPKITIKSTSKAVERGRRFWITGTVLPEHQLTAVTLWRKIGPDQFDKIKKVYLDDASRYAFSTRYTWKNRRSTFIVRWKSHDGDHVSGESRRLRIERT